RARLRTDSRPSDQTDPVGLEIADQGRLREGAVLKTTLTIGPWMSETQGLRRVRSAPWADKAFEWLTRSFAFLVFSILVAILVSLVIGSQQTLEKYGFSFMWSTDWDPVQEKFGALVPIYGTLVTSLVAMLIGVPVSFGIAIFLTELSPSWLKRPLGTAIELLAAIPSIIYGMW